jgi:diguanylate cyclase (GGDEF)-like protein/PAS domain S-box-containing protein
VNENRFSGIVNRSNDFITLIDRSYTYQFANSAYCAAIERPKDEIEGHTVSEVWGEEKFRTRLKAVIDQCLSGEVVEYIDSFKFGPFRKHMHVCYYPFEEDGEPTHALVFSHDITRLTEIETRLTQYEYLDPVTGLFNRRSLRVILDKEVYRAKRQKTPVAHALMFISLEGFPKLNQSFGPDLADIILENTGIRVRGLLRDSDYVFRFDGTELTVLLTDVTRPEDAGIVAEKLHDAITLPYSHHGVEIGIEATIGIAVFPGDGETSVDLIQNAASAVVEARSKHEPYALFKKSLHEEAIARAALKSELVRAFEARQFVLHYQPFVDEEGTIVGAEALIRWNHPSRGLLYPASFVTLAEETRLISAIDKWALYEVCRQLDEWSALEDFYISMNISARDLLDEYLVEAVELALQRASGVPAARLKLELTERISMDDPDRSIRTMQALIDMGVDVWIDDFGTGQSSLAYLKELPATVLKIDRVFIEQIADNEDDLIYLDSIIRAIRSRRKRVVIEGVSTAEQAAAVRKIGCELIQGYYFSKPIPAHQLHELLARGAKLPLS